MAHEHGWHDSQKQGKGKVTPVHKGMDRHTPGHMSSGLKSTKNVKKGRKSRRGGY